VVQKTIINVVELEKNMPRPIKPLAHLAPSLWYVLESRMGLVNWEWKSQNPSKLANTLALSLLQNVGAVHESLFIIPMNSLFLHWSPFTTTSEFTQNPVKSLGIHGHLLL
jgi:hypothetical protein